MKKTILLFLTIVINVIASAQTKSIVYFDSNSSELKPASKKVLDSISTFLKDKNNCKISISAYCDNTGIDRFNQILSEFRAESVFNYFRNKNLDITFTSIKGYSSDNPIADNDSEAGKAKNRRVEITISPVGSISNSSEKKETKTPESKQVDEQVIVSELYEAKKAFSENSTINDLEIGKTLVLKNLNFEGGTAVLLPEAQPTMELLLKTMKENPTLEIEIGGHVCCFDDMPLSVLRAQTVFKYLKKKGINESRMTYKGYSRNKPIIEDDRHEAEARVNRRVEITVLKK